MSNISYFTIFILVFMKLKIFIKEYLYSIIAPLISSIIFIVILKTISEYYNLLSIKSNFMNFIIPGIIVMIIIQEAFSNISETMIHMKHFGTFKNILMAPITRVEIAIAYLIAVTIIGIVVAIINLTVINFFVNINLFNFKRFIYYISLTSILFGSIGAIIGFLSYTWDSQQGFFNFIIAPISLLSGTFFSAEAIEGNLKYFIISNPFYHLVSNIRKTFENDSIYNNQIDILLIFLLFVIIYITLYIFKKGYRVID